MITTSGTKHAMPLHNQGMFTVNVGLGIFIFEKQSYSVAQAGLNFKAILLHQHFSVRILSVSHHACLRVEILKHMGTYIKNMVYVLSTSF